MCYVTYFKNEFRQNEAKMIVKNEMTQRVWRKWFGAAVRNRVLQKPMPNTNRNFNASGYSDNTNISDEIERKYSFLQAIALTRHIFTRKCQTIYTKVDQCLTITGVFTRPQYNSVNSDSKSQVLNLLWKL